jgi:hypothetical protein
MKGLRTTKTVSNKKLHSAAFLELNKFFTCPSLYLELYEMHTLRTLEKLLKQDLIPCKDNSPKQ